MRLKLSFRLTGHWYAITIALIESRNMPPSIFREVEQIFTLNTFLKHRLCLCVLCDSVVLSTCIFPVSYRNFLCVINVLCIFFNNAAIPRGGFHSRTEIRTAIGI